MKNLKKKKFNRIIIPGGAALLLLTLTVVIIIGRNSPIQVTCGNSNGCATIGPADAISFQFSKPVGAAAAESLFRVSPSMAGNWVWADPQHATWTPASALLPGQKLTIGFNEGAVGEKQGQSLSPAEWQLTVRNLQILALGPTQNGQELFSIDPKHPETVNQLTESAGKIYEYAAAPDGNHILFTTLGEEAEMKIWMMERDGTNPQMLLDCGQDQCRSLAWDPTAQKFAYLLSARQASLDANAQTMQLYIFDLASGQAAPFTTDNKQSVDSPRWSPNGEWISYLDLAQARLQIVNFISGETISLDQISGNIGCWTPDNQVYYFASTIAGEKNFKNIIQELNINNLQITTLLDGTLEEIPGCYDLPLCSPQNDWLAVSKRTNPVLPGKALITYNTATGEKTVIHQDTSILFGFVSWSPQGDHILYQLASWESESDSKEIWVWDQTTRMSTKIISGYSSPQWLP